MSITMNLAPFSAALASKKKQITAATRPAAQAAAQIIYEQTRINCPVSDHAHFFYGKNSKKTGVKYFFKSGNLRDSIYQVFSKDNSTETKATYHIAWSHIAAPYGFMVHNGTSHSAAHPFLVKAIHEQGPRAAEAMRAKFLEGVQS